MKFLRRIATLLVILVAVAAGLVYFLSTPDMPDSVLMAKYGQPPSRLLALPGGTRAHYRDYMADSASMPDATPTLVLLHGSNASLHTWEPWVRQFSSSMRVITVDLPGHGLTGATVEADYSPEGMVAFVDSFTRTLGLAQFVLGGNSMGGHIAWRYTLAHPERVSKLVLVDPGGITMPGMDTPQPMAFRLARSAFAAPLLRRVTPRSLFAKTIKQAFYDKSLVTEQMIDRYWELNRRPGTREATFARFKLPRFDPANMPRLHEIAVPTLVLWGREDVLLPVAYAEYFRQTIPQVQVIIYDRCGHLPMEEVPARSAEDVRRFVEGDKRPTLK
jgi:pimeloyl-ACP methyl ester carboxylesterase